MSTKQLVAVVLYLAAILVPTGLVAARYGFNALVDRSGSGVAVDQILTISVAVILGAVTGMAAGRLLKSESDGLLAVLRWLSNDMEDTRRDERRARSEAA
jgi:hypothetical protein